MSSEQETRQRRQAMRDREAGGEKSSSSSSSHSSPPSSEYLQRGEVLAKDAYHKFCDTCGQLKGYPRLMTALLLLSAFCLGIGTTAIAGRMGYFVPSTGHFTRDRTSIEAHAALDTLLGHMHGLKRGVNDKVDGASDRISAARELLINVMASKAKDWKESLRDTASDLGDRLTNLKDSASETASHLKERALHKGEAAKQEAHGWTGDLKDRIQHIPSVSVIHYPMHVIP